MNHPSVHITLAVAISAVVPVTSAQAQPAPSLKPKETEILVPPQGAAVEVPLHSEEVCILSFPSPLASKALTSSAGFEIRSWGEDSIAVGCGSFATAES